MIAQTTDITFRVEPVGGSIAEEPLGKRDAFRERYRYVFLVHGFSVSTSAALASYDKFKANLFAISQSFKRDVLTISCPDDSKLGKIGLLTYPKQVGAALQAAPIFGRFLANCKAPNEGPAEIILVCHSLGSRLVAEALPHMHASENFNQKTRVKVHMMAPAVPLGVVLEEEHFCSFFKQG